MSATSEVDDDRVDGDMKMSIIGLEVPGYGRSGLDLAIRFEGFDGVSLARIIETLEQADDSVTSDELNALLGADIDRAPCRCMAYGIRQQIVEDLLQTAQVSLNGH